MKVYERHTKCCICHSIAGKGKRQGPLDGVGCKLTADEIRVWLIDPKDAARPRSRRRGRRRCRRPTRSCAKEDARRARRLHAQSEEVSESRRRRHGEVPPSVAVAGLVAGVLLLTTPVLAQRAHPLRQLPRQRHLPGLSRRSGLRRTPAGKLGLDARKFGGSIHGGLGLACVDCHADLKSHRRLSARRQSSRASTARAATSRRSPPTTRASTRTRAGSRRRASRPRARTATRRTRSAARRTPLSTTYALNLPATCSRCHGDRGDHQGRAHRDRQRRGALQGQHSRPRGDAERPARRGQLHELPRQPRHPAEDRSGQPRAIARTSRRRAAPATRASRRSTTPACTARRSAEGNAKAPVCADCHSAHQIQRADVSSWQLDVIRECGTCHVDKIKTYRDTFHGQVTSLGFVRVATCAACHGAHNILPSQRRPLDDLAGARRCRPASNAIRTRRPDSRSTIRTPTSTTAIATRCCTTRRRS